MDEDALVTDSETDERTEEVTPFTISPIYVFPNSKSLPESYILGKNATI